MFTFDFETKGIEPRPDYPPAPVGVAVLNGRTRPLYLAWDHPDTRDPHARARALTRLRAGWEQPLLCHHAAFDLAVAHERLALPLPDGKRINDTMFLAFLLDPYGELSLKPLAERYLGLPPTERDLVRAWLQANVKTPLGRKPTDKQCGALISEAPAALVGKYAVGDVERTKMLYEYMAPIVKERGMWEAYRRECEIVPMLLDNSAQGIPLDRVQLIKDTKHYEFVLEHTEHELRYTWSEEIGGTAPHNFGSGEELAEALSRNKHIQLPLTPTGKLSTAKETLAACLPTSRVKGLLLYRSALVSCLESYMRPWLEQGNALHTNWNQVRDYSDHGAKTGRLSSSPNTQNYTSVEKYEQLIALMRACKCYYDWCRLPNLRSYIVAPPGMTLFSRDYSQQELRLLAHYEDATLAQAYRDDPALDLHVYVANVIRQTTGLVVDRKRTKTINFGKIYGMGAPMLSSKLGITVEEARGLLIAYNHALPSVPALTREIVALGQRGESIRTLGGRRYSTPAPSRVDGGEVRSNEYKLLNYLIQGSAADQTKQAMRAWWREHLSLARNGTRFLLTVHDQLVGCAPTKEVERESALLDEFMRGAFKLDVPVRTDATYGTNFGAMS